MTTGYEASKENKSQGWFVLAALVHDQQAPHGGEQLKETLEENTGNGSKSVKKKKTVKAKAEESGEIYTASKIEWFKKSSNMRLEILHLSPTHSHTLQLICKLSKFERSDPVIRANK